MNICSKLQIKPISENWLIYALHHKAVLNQRRCASHVNKF